MNHTYSFFAFCMLWQKFFFVFGGFYRYCKPIFYSICVDNPALQGLKKVNPAYNKAILCCFSGTGNARNAAQWFHEVAENAGLEVEVIYIDKTNRPEIPNFTGKLLVGFFSPTHGFNLPPLVLKFICRFPKVKNADVFLLNTRGGLKFSRWFLPGLSGAAQIFAAMILRLKGFKIKGMQPVDLPSNWIILHPGLRKNVVLSIHQRCRRIVTRFASRLVTGKKVYKSLYSLPIDILVIPIAVLYYFIGRFFLAKTLIATSACNDCGICIKQCPVGAIKRINNRPYWTYKCESCMHCINICPQRAIQTTHAFSITLILLSVFILSPLLFQLLNYFGLSNILNRLHLSIIPESIVFLGFVFVCYRLLHYFMRFTLVNRIITYTSLSWFIWWRRYKAPDYKKDIA